MRKLYYKLKVNLAYRTATAIWVVTQKPKRVAAKAFKASVVQCCVLNHKHNLQVKVFMCEDPLELEGVIQLGNNLGRVTVRSNGIDKNIRITSTISGAYIP